MDDKTFNTLIKQGEVGLILMDGGADLTDSQIRKVKRVSKDLADDRLNSMMAELAMTPGFQEMMLTPIMAKILPAVFGKEAVQEQKEKLHPEEYTENKQSVSEPKAEVKEKKDPFKTYIGPAPKGNIAAGDTAGDILSRLFSLEQEYHNWTQNTIKDEKKFQKLLNEQKDRHLDEVIAAVTGKSPSKLKKFGRFAKSSGMLKYGVLGVGILGAALLSKKAFASINTKGIFPDFSLGDLNIPGLDRFTSPNVEKATIGGAGTSEFKNLIGQESGQNYESLVITSGQKVNLPKKLTEMSLDEIYGTQDEMRRLKYPSTALGKYGMTKETLQMWSKQEGLDPSKTIFNEETQDRLMHRGVINAGLHKYQSGEITKEQFQTNLARTWAAIPVPHDMEVKDEFGSRSLKAGQSYYHGVGNNRAYIKQEEIDKTLLSAKTPAGSTFGMRNNPFGLPGREMHLGHDFPAKTGDSVISTDDGVVTKVAFDEKGYGKWIEVDHGNGIKTRYAHLSKQDVAEGDKVLKGQKIGEVGSTGRSTGPHLHYEKLENGQRINPIQGLTINPIKTASLDPINRDTQIASLTNADTGMPGVASNTIMNNTVNVLNSGQTIQITRSDPRTHSNLYLATLGRAA